MHQHFHIQKNYFLSHSVGCLLRTTPDFVQKTFFTPWNEKGGNAWPAWLDIINNFRTEIANFLNVKQGDICPQSNVSSGLTKLLYSLPKRTGRNVILLSPNDFPTIGFALKQAERSGYTLRFVEGDITDVENWKQAIDENVHIVHITHAISNTSQLLPAADICALAKKKDVYSVVDIAQSVGIIPIDLGQWKPDFAIGTSVKFLCGGPGACFLYICPKILPKCEPVDVGWFSHENPFEMDIHHFKYAPDALRFFGGTPSPAPYTAALNALQFWKNYEQYEIHTKAQAYLDILTASVPDEFLVSPKNSHKRGGTLVISPKQRMPIRNALENNMILHDERHEGFRFSVHAYTPQDDVNLLAYVLKTTL